MNFIDSETLSNLRNTFPEGTRVRLTKMEDVQAPRIGTCGTVRHVDDMGTIHVRWDSGSSLGIVHGEDQCEKI